MVLRLMKKYTRLPPFFEASLDEIRTVNITAYQYSHDPWMISHLYHLVEKSKRSTTTMLELALEDHI